MKPLSVRQAQIIEQVAHGLSNKRIANDLGLSIRTVEEHIRVAASRLPGDGSTRHRIFLWFFHIEDVDN